jgi:hypothetical protein
MLITPADSRSLDQVQKLIGSSPEEITLDVDFSHIRPGGDSERGRSSSRRGESSSRGGRERTGRPSRERERESAPEPITAPLAPAIAPDVVAEAPAAIQAEAPQKANRSRRRPKPDRDVTPATVAEAPVEAKPRPSPTPIPVRGVAKAPESVEDDDDRRGTRGFGADTPAFLLRPAWKGASADD